jgi:isoamylase
MPKSVVVDPSFDWHGQPTRNPIPWDRTILYETHLRGYTKNHPRVPEAHRGTYKGMMVPDVLDYIKKLGVTSIEFLPLHSFILDSNLLEKGLTNYWGYNSIGFFAPNTRYAHESEQSLREFKEMVGAIHDAGLEVILDVVYNHTAEGNERGPTLSYKGIDNASYYRLLNGQPRYYINDTGTGNTVNLSHPRVIQMVTDSLRYWAEETHVDGFRFDLGTILAREPNGFDNQSGFLKACSQDPVLATVKLIAEPWDCGPGGYQVGEFPPGWAEWNDKFRDETREFWKGDLTAGTIAPRLLGSPQEFNRQGRKPWACVNFVTAHDGFTLNDCVTYNEKHNEANGEDNKDGSSDNRSFNYGVEGPTDDPDIQRVRGRQIRNSARYVAAEPGYANAARWRRVRSDPAGQQQRLLPGQRHQLGQLGDRGEGPEPDPLRFPRHRSTPPLPDPASQPVPDRGLQRGARHQGAYLGRCRRRQDGCGRLEHRALLRPDA